MEEERTERVDVEDWGEEAPPKKRSPLIKIAAVVVALAVAGVAVWWFAFSNNPPTASFTAQAFDLRVLVDGTNSTDPDGNIATYTWDWGDGTSETTTGPETDHTYPDETSYTIGLTVTDTRGAAGTASRTVSIQVFPTAHFIARHDRMSVSFDGTGSFHALNASIASYRWDFGDGTTDTSGPVVSHTYATSQRYAVTLTVTDARNREGTASRYVSPADTTVDILAEKFFEAECPYRDYWGARAESYGDQVLQSEMPCTNYYPWVLFSSSPSLQPFNPSYVYTLYRWDARVRNHPGYSLIEPVMLPVFNSSVNPVPTSYVQINLTFEYLDTKLFDDLYTKSYFGLPPGSFAVGSTFYSDGFGHSVMGTFTMDLTMSKRILGVEANDVTEARAWWARNVNPNSPRNPGPLGTRYGAWLEDVGNGKYDVYNGFEWYYVTDYTWLNGSVADDGTTTVQFATAGWALEVLEARWFYWGKADYQKAVCVKWRNTTTVTCDETLDYGAILPQGWSPMETCWCEHATINGRITSSLDLDFVGIQGYHFEAWGNWGPDGIPKTADDLPAWVFTAYMMDYVPRAGSGSSGASGFPNSALRWYEDLEAYHGTPGSYGYGEQIEYLVGQGRWPLNAGSTLTIVLPRFEVPWYDPVRSTWNAEKKIGDYYVFNSTMTLRLVRPGGSYFIWDSRAKVLSMAGPHDWGVPPTQLPLEGTPWIEFGPETRG